METEHRHMLLVRQQFKRIAASYLHRQSIEDDLVRLKAVTLLSCATCRSANVRRSYFRFYDVPFLLLYIPIRCRDCHARFYTGRFGKASLIFYA